MYTIERLRSEIPVEKYIEEYVNVEEFLEACKKCMNYEKKWSCPPYDFDVLNYWRQYNKFIILGYKIIFDKEYTDKIYNEEELKDITYSVLSKEKKNLADETYKFESEIEGSISLSAGSCTLCGDGMMDNNVCTREHCKEGTAKEHCLHFDKMRYSIESLGGNVGKTCSKLLGVELEWVEGNKLPSHFVLVSGLLKK